MNIFKKINPEWALRVGLGLMYLYSGFNLFYYPQNWYGFVPKWFSLIIYQWWGSVPLFVGAPSPIEMYLRLQGIGEFIIGVLFLAWFLGKLGPRIAAILSVLEIASILLFVGIDLITFRDIGLLGAALALLTLLFSDNDAT